MIRHFASLAAVLAALALVAAPEQAFAADVADDTRGAASEPVQTASDSADSSQVVASEPVQPVQPAQASAAGQAGQAGHGLGTLPTSSFALEFDPSNDDGSGEARPEGLAPDDETVDPGDETPSPPEQPELPEPDQTSSPAARHAVGFGGDARVVIIERGRSGGDPRAHVFVFGLAVVGERPDLLVQDLRIGSGLHERFVLGG